MNKIDKEIYDFYSQKDDLKLASSLLNLIHNREDCLEDIYNKCLDNRIRIVKQILTDRGIY